ncbi:MAG: glycosyltransferase family 4 protein [Micrococcales bacterium]|nr:glycosyltransferase family 4 protein [Micrococcales bacterium]
MDEIGFIDPDLGRPSGGATYNDAVCAAWPTDAPPLQRTRIPLPPGRPREDVAADLAAAIRGHAVSVVDGLLGSEHPDVLSESHTAGHRVVLLLHMPRPAEGGLSPDERERLAALEAAALDAVAAVLAPSRWAARDLLDRYGAGDPRGRGRLRVAVPGAHPAPLAHVHEPPCLVQLGAIGPLKNQLLTAQTAAACADLDFRLRLVGPVVDEAYAAQIATVLAPLGARASLEPAVEGLARDELLDAASLLVSVATRETYGLVVTEALARGVPAVVGRGTGAEEALMAGGGIPGGAVATDDPAELTAVLRAYLTGAARRERWQEAARAASERLPGWESTARTIAQACLATGR